MALTVTVLVENRTLSTGLEAGRGLCLHLDDGHQQVLFDTGPDERLIANAGRLGIDLARVSYIVLSHGHRDHSGGLPALAGWYRARGLRPVLVAHPDAFVSRGVRLALGRHSHLLRSLGAPMTAAEAAGAFDLRLTASSLRLGDSGLVFLGEILRLPAYGTRPIGRVADDSGRWLHDTVRDDSGLAWDGDRGLVVISGCAHSGICNLVEHARSTLCRQQVRAVLGGFHLRSAGPRRLGRVRRYFARLQVERIAACHCSGWARHWLPGQQDIATGSRLTFDGEVFGTTLAQRHPADHQILDQKTEHAEPQYQE